MKTAKIISILGVLAMTAVLIYGFTVGNFSGVRFRPALSKPDGQFSLHPAFQHNIYSGMSMVSSMTGKA